MVTKKASVLLRDKYEFHNFEYLNFKMTANMFFFDLPNAKRLTFPVCNTLALEMWTETIEDEKEDVTTTRA